LAKRISELACRVEVGPITTLSPEQASDAHELLLLALLSNHDDMTQPISKAEPPIALYFFKTNPDDYKYCLTYFPTSRCLTIYDPSAQQPVKATTAFHRQMMKVVDAAKTR
jgi:hypothetical protein